VNDNDLRTYIGVKQIQAMPMCIGDFNRRKGVPTARGVQYRQPGYYIRDADGLESWSPVSIFETQHHEIKSGQEAGDLVRDFLATEIKVEEVIEGDSTVFKASVTTRNGVLLTVDSAPTAEEASGLLLARAAEFLSFVMEWVNKGLVPAHVPEETEGS